VVACLSKQLARKQEGIQQFRAKVDTFKEKAAAKAGKFFKGSSQLALFLLRSSIWSVFQAGCDITNALYQGVGAGQGVSDKSLSACTEEIFRCLLTRTGDAAGRVRDLAVETGVRLVRSPRVEQLDVLDSLLTAEVKKGEAAGPSLSRVRFTSMLVEEYGLAGEKDDLMSPDRLSQYALGALQHGDPGVRAAGQDLLLTLYTRDPVAVRANLPEDNARARKSHALRVVYQRMEEQDKEGRK